ncbi:unnamed protein product [Haemonchus placei]|uniref:Neurotransmitter-gated ion-channel transmembrane domain-containing protein n=1 Tax=Haemonchus placei TaxID=6290 RepID=A0A3P8CQR3_HAEPC|nr:unnamed protein product [Haemonchus placei]
MTTGTSRKTDVIFQVQNIHFRTANFPISDRIRQIFIDTLGRKLLISRATEAANFHRKAQHNKQINALSAMSILQKQFHKTALQIEMAAKAKKPMSTVNSLFLELPMMNRSMSVKAAAVNPQLIQNKHRKTSIHLVKSYTTSRNQQIRRRGSAVRNKLRRAEQNVHYIAQTLTERRQAEETEADWQFISLVIDRILLVIFATFISAGTLITFLSAPSITDTRQPITSM